MKIGMIGLGRMGGNMVSRLLKGGHECVVFDPNTETAKTFEKKGAILSSSLEEMASKLSAPRVFWIMVPAGAPTEQTVLNLVKLSQPGDILIDGGNSNYKDSVRRAHAIRESGRFYLDCGTSGGVFGGERGYCLMIGGEKEAFKTAEPIFKTLAPGKGDIPSTPSRKSGQGTAENGYLYCGPSGSGHFVKMIHNGIEYGIMQAYAEGFDILKNASSPQLPIEHQYHLDTAEISELWRRGSVVSSWLLDLTASALAEDSSLSAFEGRVPDSGEGRWTVEAAVEESVPAVVLTAALYERFRSRTQGTYADKLLSAMRSKFGGHTEAPKQ
jgi:6-phosphogluconate dehydrogenase